MNKSLPRTININQFSKRFIEPKEIIVATTNVLSATGSAICPNLDCHENFLAKNPSRIKAGQKLSN